MSDVEFAVIADVHGNAWALAAVLADIAAHGVTRIINLGDNANGPLDPARSVALLRASGAVHVRGNGDRMTGEGGPTMRKSAAFARERLGTEELRWLRELPMTATGDGWLAFHALPADDERYFMENVVAGRATLAGDGEIAARLGPTQAALVLCGHTHLPRLVQLPDGRTVLNPGSVGLPAYEDDNPVPHVVENGTPHARYALVRRPAGRWAAEFRAVPYDWRSAGAAARAAGWEEWARYVETGRAVR